MYTEKTFFFLNSTPFRSSFDLFFQILLALSESLSQSRRRKQKKLQKESDGMHTTTVCITSSTFNWLFSLHQLASTLFTMHPGFNVHPPLGPDAVLVQPSVPLLKHSESLVRHSLHVREENFPQALKELGESRLSFHMCAKKSSLLHS